MNLTEQIYRKCAIPVINILAKLKVSPNIITVATLFLDFIAFYFLIKGSYLLAGIFVILGMYGDVLDGGVARKLKKVSKFGEYLDNSLGMVGYNFIFFGIYFAVKPNMILFFLAFLALNMDPLCSKIAKSLWPKKTTTKKRLVAWSCFERRTFTGLMIIFGFFNLLLFVWATIGNIYWIARFWVCRKKDREEKE